MEIQSERRQFGYVGAVWLASARRQDANAWAITPSHIAPDWLRLFKLQLACMDSHTRMQKDDQTGEEAL